MPLSIRRCRVFPSRPVWRCRPRGARVGGALPASSRPEQARSGDLFNRRCSREGNLGVCWRRTQPLVRGTSARCGTAVSDGAGKRCAGARYHAVAEAGVPVREIAVAIGQGLKLPVVAQSPAEAAAHFGWLAMFVGLDMPASSALTQQRLGWHPTAQPGMVADLQKMDYLK